MVAFHLGEAHKKGEDNLLTGDAVSLCGNRSPFDPLIKLNKRATLRNRLEAVHNRRHIRLDDDGRTNDQLSCCIYDSSATRVIGFVCECICISLYWWRTMPGTGTRTLECEARHRERSNCVSVHELTY